MLHAVAPELWTAEHRLSFPGGVRLPVRMTVVGLPGGALLVHNPIPLDGGLGDQLDRLGSVRYVVAPNRLHHRFAGPCLQRYPGAGLHGAPGLPAKRPTLRFAGVLGEGPAPPWAEVLEQALLEGAPGLSEVLFFHRPSRSLLVTDLLFNVRTPETWATSLVLRLMGTRGRLAMSRAWRRYRRDRAAFRASVERVLAWDFDRILPGHGEVFEAEDARATAREALAWALR
jgi:hypothetical protein